MIRGVAGADHPVDHQIWCDQLQLAESPGHRLHCVNTDARKLFHSFIPLSWETRFTNSSDTQTYLFI